MRPNIRFGIPSKFAFAGADDNTDIDKMLELGKKYPGLEFGILLHPDKFGQSRYPSLGWIMELTSKTKEYRANLASNSVDGSPVSSWHDFQLSLHICGDYAERILEDGYFGEEEFMDQMDILQINIGRQITALEHQTLNRWFNHYGKSLCLQVPDIPKHRLPCIRSFLVDNSRGTGTPITKFPDPYDVRIAYEHWGVNIGIAGGIGLDNVYNICETFANQNYGVRTYYVDMESKIRNASNEFDLGIAEDILVKFYGKQIFDYEGRVWGEEELREQIRFDAQEAERLRNEDVLNLEREQEEQTRWNEINRRVEEMLVLIERYEDENVEFPDTAVGRDVVAFNQDDNILGLVEEYVNEGYYQDAYSGLVRHLETQLASRRTEAEFERQKLLNELHASQLDQLKKQSLDEFVEVQEGKDY